MRNWRVVVTDEGPWVAGEWERSRETYSHRIPLCAFSNLNYVHLIFFFMYLRWPKCGLLFKFYSSHFIPVVWVSLLTPRPSHCRLPLWGDSFTPVLSRSVLGFFSSLWNNNQAQSMFNNLLFLKGFQITLFDLILTESHFMDARNWSLKSLNDLLKVIQLLRVELWLTQVALFHINTPCS